MRTAEQCEVLGTFLSLLEGATGDGGAKRAAGLKPSWKVDESHLAAAYRHLDPSREPYDEDSGLPKEVHAAWRLLAVAWQRMRDDGKLPEEPPSDGEKLFDELWKRTGSSTGVNEPTALAGPSVQVVENIAETQGRWWLQRPDDDAGPERIPTARSYAQPEQG